MRIISRSFLTLIALGCLFLPLGAQENSAPMTLQEAVNGYQSVTNGQAGVPEDWSSRHMVFSRPAPGTGSYDKVTHDARYWQQQIRRLSQAEAGTALMVGRAKRKLRRLRRRLKLHRDWTVTLGTNGKVGSEMYPAKFSFNPPGTPDCTNDFVVFNTSLAGSATQAGIVGLNNLYQTTCSPTVPHVNWAYNIAAGTALTSPVLSLDGTQVAFVQSEGGVAHLVLLKWSANDGTVSAPDTLANTAAASYRACTAPCRTDLTFSGDPNPNDTNSAPYVDYSGDILYVGANDGTLHKFTGVFTGTSAESGSPWPVTVDSNKFLSSPVFDFTSGKVFVGDAEGQLSAVTASSGALASTTTNFGKDQPIVDAPLVDGSTEKVFWFGGANANNKGQTVIEQTDTSLGTPRLVAVGGANSTSPSQPAHGGAFDA